MADPALWNIVVRKNVPWPIQMTLTDDDDPPAPIDLTGYEIAMQVRLYQGAPGDPLIDLGTVESAIEGIEITDAEAGEFAIRIDQTTLEDLPASDGENKPAVFHHDLLLTASGEPTEVYAYGSFTVYTGVTR